MRRAAGVLLGMGMMLALGAAHGAVVGKEVEYDANGIRLVGFLAWDEASSEARPGVLVVHEWWGLNDYARSRARQLAELGYTALAVDMYGGGKQAEHPDQAGAFAGHLAERPDEVRARFTAALELLRMQESMDPERIAAIGYCFGGGVVLDMARSGVDIDGVVSFHGSLASSLEARPGEVKAKVAVFHGADDPFVPQDDVDNFHAEMEAAGVDYEFVAYPGVIHGFTNPEADRFGKEFDLPLAYDAGADADSWRQMQEFFREIFHK
ncbi:MAG: dienelactone hydrolase family protein [Gammaproteobacteria bacterium]|nr:dienelactone hydrolase family protein [Gammaproteobacteria bacterium]